MNGLSRRAVLAAGALAVTTEQLVSPDPAVAASGSYRRARFLPLLGKTFRLDDRTVRLAAIAGDDRSFSLTFTGRSALPQGTYVLRRAGFEATVLLVVPIDASGRTLEAVVNPG